MSGWSRSWMSAMACWATTRVLQPTSFRWLVDRLPQNVSSQQSMPCQACGWCTPPLSGTLSAVVSGRWIVTVSQSDIQSSTAWRNAKDECAVWCVV